MRRALRFSVIPLALVLAVPSLADAHGGFGGGGGHRGGHVGSGRGGFARGFGFRTAPSTHISGGFVSGAFGRAGVVQHSEFDRGRRSAAGVRRFFGEQHFGEQHFGFAGSRSWPRSAPNGFGAWSSYGWNGYGLAGSWWGGDGWAGNTEVVTAYADQPPVVVVTPGTADTEARTVADATLDYSYVAGCHAIPNGYHCDTSRAPH